MSQIVTLTMNPALDRSLSIEHVAPSIKLRCDRDRLDPGGGGVNVSRAIHTMGGDTLPIYTCGGHMGAIYRRLVEREGIGGIAIEIEGETREHIKVHETSTGSIYRFQEPGPELDREDTDNAITTVCSLDPPPDYLVLSGSLPDGVGDDFYARIIHKKQEDTRVVVDTTAEGMLPALDEGGIFLIKPNVRELGELMDRTLEGEAEIAEAARGLIDRGAVEIVVTSLGPGGSIVITEDLRKRVEAPAVKVRSKVGAGDSMVGGIVLGLDQGKSVLEAVRFGTAVAAAAIMDQMTGLGSREDAERVYRQMIELLEE